MFPDNHTLGLSDTKRAFLMGNALVCGVITGVAEELRNRLVPLENHILYTDKVGK